MISKLKDTLLLVGDRFSDRAMLHDIFEASFNLLEAEGIPQALMFLEQNSSCIAAVLADIPLDDEAQVRALSAACLSGQEPTACAISSEPVYNCALEIQGTSASFLTDL